MAGAYQSHRPDVAQAPTIYGPYPARVAHDAVSNDLSTYQQPIPKLTGWYMTFWQGNQVPGVTIGTAPSPAQNYRYMEQLGAQRSSGAGGGGFLTAIRTWSLIQRIQAAWAAASGPS